jgi:hypothetical protein
MALLSDSERAALSQIFQAFESSRRAALSGVTSDDIRAAINAVDQWVEDNQTSFNQAIPQPARTGLTTSQKAQILFYVVRRRYEVT